MSAPDDPVEVVPDPRIVNRDDIVQRTQCIVCQSWRLLLLLAWLRLTTSKSARFGAVSPTQLCETFSTSSHVLCARGRASGLAFGSFDWGSERPADIEELI
jgi:hypothetical protein